MRREEAVGYERVRVRRAGDLGVDPDSQTPEARGLKYHGWGTDLKAPAWDEVRDRLADRGVDVAKLAPKTHVATIEYNLYDWTYSIRWELEILEETMIERVAGWFR